MNKFGLIDDADDLALKAEPSLSERLASFPPAAPKHRIDLAAVDAAAAPHGFISRESGASMPATPTSSRRRRLTPVEPTRHLAIRLTASQYDRFVAYADKHKLTYHDALSRLLASATD